MESSTKQATLGKIAVGIIVTDTNNNRISFARASGRFFAKIIGAPIGVFTAGIGFIFWYFMMLWDKRKQNLYDKIADTIVLNRQPH